MSGRTTLCGVNQVSTFKGIEACHPTFTDIFLVDTKLTKVQSWSKFKSTKNGFFSASFTDKEVF